MQYKQDFLDRMNKITELELVARKIWHSCLLLAAVWPADFIQHFLAYLSPVISHDRLRRAFDRMAKNLFEILFILSIPKIAE